MENSESEDSLSVDKEEYMTLKSTCVYEVQDSPTHKVRVVIGGITKRLGRWDTPHGRWALGKVDSNGVFTKQSMGICRYLKDGKMLCFNENDTPAMEIRYVVGGIKIEGGRFLNKID